jgi:hypothetical protein
MRISWCGLVLAIIYIAFAAWVSFVDMGHCSGGLDIDLCGLGAFLITFPAMFVLDSLGVTINYRNPVTSDYLLQTLVIAVCAILIYLIGWVLGWLGMLLLRVTGLSKPTPVALDPPAPQ